MKMTYGAVDQCMAARLQMFGTSYKTCALSVD